jgi:hypothetical protein
MKEIYILLICLMKIVSISNAQKQDYVWKIGYKSNNNGSITTGETLNFNFNPFQIDTVITGIETLRVSAGICDSLGNLLFYTNGRNICNKDGTLLGNSENLTDCSLRDGCNYTQQAFVVPYPNHAKQYILFANDNYDVNLAISSNRYALITLKYSVVDMSSLNGRGSVIEKNTSVLFDTLMNGELSGCRHANGRDWWVLVNKQYTTKWYRLLVSPVGVQVMGIQDIGFNAFERGGGQTVFSPDGNWFAAIQSSYLPNYNNFVELFQFDRCSGLLSRKTTFNVRDTAGISGIAISSNSRYLYTCTSLSLHQFDLQATNIALSKVKIAAYDGYRTIYGFWSNITVPQLAPNGKIFIATYPTTDVLHVIEAPDSAGIACNFRQHIIQLPTYNSAVPNYPNFRLGALQGSGCDTIVANNEVADIKAVMRLFPNPVHDVLNIDLTMNEYNHQGRVAVVIYDVLGRLAYRHIVSDYSSIVQVDVSEFGAGVYLVGLEIEGVVVKTEKVVVSK